LLDCGTHEEVPPPPVPVPPPVPEPWSPDPEPLPEDPEEPVPHALLSGTQTLT
jgi:hypothetical protein